jgi:hypothetical protein
MAISGSSSTPQHPTVKTPVVRAHAPDAAKAPASPAAAPAPAAPRAPLNPKLLYGGIAGGVLLVLLVALLVWKPWKAEPPRLNEEPWKIARFVSTPEFKKLSFERQFTYMDVLDDKEPAIAKAYKEQKLNDEQYAAALQAAYLGKHMKRARNYAQKGTPRLREAYLDKIIEKKHKGGSANEKPKKNAEPLDADEIKRDDSEEQETISNWPADAQAQWTSYRMALKARKEKLKDEEANRKNAATQAATKASAPDPDK